jgi:3-oxoadipate enol-lactonase
MKSTLAEAGFVDVGGARLVYEMAGEGETLLLIHGGLANRGMWDDQFEHFSQEFHTIRFDLHGMGDSSSPPGPVSFHDDVRGLLTALGVERAHILGLSFGGRIAIDFALAYPRMVRSLTLVGSGLGGYPFSDALSARIEEADELLDAGDIAQGVELELRLWIDGPRRTPDQVDPVVRERVRAMNAANYQKDTSEMELREPEIPARERLEEIRVPTLILLGAEDVTDIAAIAEVLEREIPDASRTVIDGAAHHPNMEKPEEFNRLVLDFLQQYRDTERAE